MFDILGFKALREKLGTEGLHKKFVRGIAPAISHSAAGRGKSVKMGDRQVYVPDFSRASVKFRAFSDTVIFFTEDDSFESFREIINSAFMLLQFGFGGMKFPYRGAIGWGDLINDSNEILLGSAIEDAYRGESSQAWAGAMLTQACRDFVDRRGYIDLYRKTHRIIATICDDDRRRKDAILNSMRLVSYEVPIQKCIKGEPLSYTVSQTYAIDWTIRMYKDASMKSFDSPHDEHSETIVKNTVAFEDWARKNNRISNQSGS